MSASTHHPILVGPSSVLEPRTAPRGERTAAFEAPGFDEVYRAEFGFVWRSAKRLGLRDAGLDDAVQEVFVVVHRRLAEFEGRSSLRTWLFGITLRVVRDHRRSARRRDPGPPVDPDSLRATGGGPAESAEKAEAVRLLHALLDELDDERREVFVMAELEQMPMPEIAEALGINVNTAYARLRVARQEFEQALGRHRARDMWRLR
ncbi:MAG TPA: sigma-70 family RNA polymerase sigma factor [Labilithrix sp.]|nr:sigma-70 family RNA polymerase sigma factor [Labilithrix sp.]